VRLLLRIPVFGLIYPSRISQKHPTLYLRVAIPGGTLGYPDYSGFSATELVERCAQDNSGAWREFLRRYRRPMALAIVRVLRRAGAFAPTMLDDLLQETYLHLCADSFATLHRLVSRHPDDFEQMLCLVAANVARDQLRADTSQKRGGQYRQIADPDLLFAEQIEAADSATKIEQETQLDEIDRMLRRSVDSPSAPRDRSIFWMHFQLGMSSEAIARISSIGLTQKGVESSIYRTLQLIRKTLRIKPR
jgi:RNA polymerase sigma-70 factor, ECF subfamily